MTQFDTGEQTENGNDRGSLKSQWRGETFPMGRAESSAPDQPFIEQQEMTRGEDRQRLMGSGPLSGACKEKDQKIRGKKV